MPTNLKTNNHQLNNNFNDLIILGLPIGTSISKFLNRKANCRYYKFEINIAFILKLRSTKFNHLKITILL